MSTTTDDKNGPREYDGELERLPLDQARVGDVVVPIGHPTIKPGESKYLSKFMPDKFLGYAAGVPDTRPPTHPGEMLLEEFLKPLGISQRKLADDIRLPYRQVNEIVNERRPVTPAIALRLTRYLGMSVGFWMNLQTTWDLYHAIRDEAETLSEIEPFPRPDLPEPMEPDGPALSDNAPWRL